MKTSIVPLFFAASMLCACGPDRRAQEKRGLLEAAKRFVSSSEVRFVFRDAHKRQMVKPFNERENAVVLPDDSLLLCNAEYFRLGGPQEKLELVLKNTDLRIGVSTQSYLAGDKKTMINPRELEALLGPKPTVSISLDGKRLSAIPAKRKYKKLNLASEKLQFVSEEGGTIRRDGARIIIETDSISAWKQGAPGFADGVNPRKAAPSSSGKTGK